jgi:hypothetical protein
LAYFKELHADGLNHGTVTVIGKLGLSEGIRKGITPGKHNLLV